MRTPGSARTRAHRRSAAARAARLPVSGRMIANSSPPTRQARSLARSSSRAAAATRRSTRSPSWWPCTSFRSLKSSRSNTISDSGTAVALGPLELVAQALVVDAVVVQAGEPVGLGLVQQPDPVLGVVERERGQVGELAHELELLGAERRADAQPVGVERADRRSRTTSGTDTIASDSSLGRARDDGDAGIALGRGDVCGLAVLDHPAGQALAEAQRRGHDLVGPLVAGVDGHDLAVDLVDAVDRERVHRHEPVSSVEMRSKARPG